MEYMNAIMEQYRRAHVNYLQDDWVEWLPLAELAVNNQASETTGPSPVPANKGINLRCQFNLSPAAENDINDRQALTISKTLAKIHSHIPTEINTANCHHKDNANAY
jgi:hypothetical protein